MKMKLSVIILATIVFFINSYGFAKVNSQVAPTNKKASVITDNALIEELTGKKDNQQTIASKKLKNAPLPIQHYLAGKKAAQEKNYILAIKHFNTVLKNYPQSAQVTPALLAKAKVYQEMGLIPQAAHNMRMAQQKAQAKNTNSKVAAKTPEKIKAVK